MRVPGCQAHRRAGDRELAIATLNRYLEQGGDAVENRGEVEQIMRELTAPNSGATSTSGTASGEGGDDGLLIGAVSAYGFTVAAAAVWGIFGGLALAEDGRLADGCGASASCQPDEVADADTFALIADIGWVTAAAAAVTGTLLLVLSLTRGDDDASTAELPIGGWADPNGAGVTRTFRF